MDAQTRALTVLLLQHRKSILVLYNHSLYIAMCMLSLRGREQSIICEFCKTKDETTPRLLNTRSLALSRFYNTADKKGKIESKNVGLQMIYFNFRSIK